MTPLPEGLWRLDISDFPPPLITTTTDVPALMTENISAGHPGAKKIFLIPGNYSTSRRQAIRGWVENVETRHSVFSSGHVSVNF